VTDDQSRSLSQALRTVVRPPVDGVIMSSVCVGMKGLWGMVSCMVVALIACASPWRRCGSMEFPAHMDCMYPYWC
jgi:hypothetical protein